jgi:hypothetical protein
MPSTAPVPIIALQRIEPGRRGRHDALPGVRRQVRHRHVRASIAKTAQPIAPESGRSGSTAAVPDRSNRSVLVAAIHARG